MSTSNIPAFFEKVNSDPALAAKVEALYAHVEMSFAQALSILAKENGARFSAEDYLCEQRRLADMELSDSVLSEVAGGTGEECVRGEGMGAVGYENPPYSDGSVYRNVIVLPRPSFPSPRWRAR